MAMPHSAQTDLMTSWLHIAWVLGGGVSYMLSYEFTTFLHFNCNFLPLLPPPLFPPFLLLFSHWLSSTLVMPTFQRTSSFNKKYQNILMDVSKMKASLTPGSPAHNHQILQFRERIISFSCDMASDQSLLHGLLCMMYIRCMPDFN